MWRRIADDGNLEQLDGNALHRRTHTFDPKRTSALSGIKGRFQSAAAFCSLLLAKRFDAAETSFRNLADGDQAKVDEMSYHFPWEALHGSYLAWGALG